jgi:hypothetical protein
LPKLELTQKDEELELTQKDEVIDSLDPFEIPEKIPTVQTQVPAFCTRENARKQSTVGERQTIGWAGLLYTLCKQFFKDFFVHSSSTNVS